MKTRLVISFILIFTVSLYLFSGLIINSGEESSGFKVKPPGIPDSIQSGNQNETFLVGALDCGIEQGFQNLDDVEFNLWHVYTAGNSGWFWAGVPNDTLYADISTYRTGVQAKLAAISSHNMKSIIHRPKIAMLCYGQRSDYQCESVALNDDLWFYSFQSPGHVGIDTNDTWQGETQRVRYCRPNQTTDGGAGWVVSRLKANTEQVLSFADASGIKDPSIKNWIVKPRIRIDSIVADNPANWDKEVCKIKVKGQDGDTILKDVVITVRNFLDANFNYNGRYLEEYNFSGDTDLEIDSLWGNWGGNGARGNDSIDTDNSRTDIQVYWYGNCDMWIDYVRVDNMVAHRLLSGSDPEFNNWLHWEAEDIACYSQSSAIKFYMELFAFGNIPCMAYVSRKLDSLCIKDITLTALMCPLYMYGIVPWEERFSMLNSGHVVRNYVDKVGLTDILIANYPFYTNKQTFPYQQETFAKIPNTLPIVSGFGVMANAIPPSDYDTWLQNNLDHSPSYFEEGSSSSFPWDGTARQWEGTFRWSMEMGDAISKARDIPFIYNGQSHLWYYAEGESHKEPTNEEMEMIANVSLTYGVRGLLYFFYGWWQGYISNGDTCLYPDCFGRGFVDPGYLPRDTNAYGQNKWEMVKTQVQRMKKWEPYIMSFDNANRKSYILRLARDNLIAETFFSDVISYKPNPSNYLVPLSSPETTPQRYLQTAVFNNPDQSHTRYFMIVNRRCSPLDTGNIGGDNGSRYVTIKLDSASSQFLSFNNWSIYDLERDSLIKTFDKNSISSINLGWYLPGEGKLYKIAPVMQEGGTLVANEDCSGEFDCKGEVNNGEFNIILKPSTTIHFTNSDARIKMFGGNFKSGYSSGESSGPVYLKNKDGNFWKGLVLQNCERVEMLETHFEDISPYELDSTYAADIINCGFVSIQECHFSSEQEINAGGVRANFTTDDGLDIEAYIVDNNFEMDQGDIPALSIITSGYLTFPVIIEGNTFESFTGNSSNAILLSGIEGGAIKENTISGYTNGIILIWSAMDIYGNVIDGGSEDSHGILSYASSYANLGEVGIAYTGGYNSIFCEGENAKCIEVDYSFLYLDKGYNTFNLKNYEPDDAYHLSGDISDEAYADPLDATYNCFQISGTDSAAVHNMMWSSSEEPINFNFQPDYCGDNPAEGIIAFDLGNGMYDTIFTESGGSGGSISNFQFSMFNEQSTTSDNLLDSVSLNLRKRDYERVSDFCYELLTDHIDSLKDVSIVSKLYLAELRLDCSGNRITNLKSFLEALILNNPEKVTFVKQSFYVIQKCKVSLEMYESAMTGFQEIINQNPYNYEGLVATWDYAAASLLYSLHGGSGGAVSNYELRVTNGDNNNNFQFPIYEPTDDPNDKYDSKKFTKEDRKVIKENVINSFQSSRGVEIEKVKSLENKVREGNASKTERSELKVKKTLGEVIKVKKPRDITEHINNVNGSIQKVFGTTKDNHSKEVINIIPTEYSLSQNYPNPFNPVTKINFDLSKDGYVKLIIYDLLGREITRLLNNEFRVSGRYTVDFNGSNLSSGVYFYKIETDGFIATKKMLLLK